MASVYIYNMNEYRNYIYGYILGIRKGQEFETKNLNLEK